ncbi:hypothetical protein FAGKG844_30226 [Frankia sp. AgKG'84/4]
MEAVWGVFHGFRRDRDRRHPCRTDIARTGRCLGGTAPRSAAARGAGSGERSEPAHP